MDFDQKVYDERVGRLQRVISEKPIDALWVVGIENCRYLTGVYGHSLYDLTLLVTADELVVMTSPLYQNALAGIFDNLRIGPTQQVLREIIRDNQYESVGIEVDVVSAHLLAQMELALDQTKLTAADEFVGKLRLVKDKHEIDALRQACKLTELALAEVLKQLSVGQTEKEIAWMLEKELRERGCEDLSFRPLIVASGPNSAKAHHFPGDRELCGGDIIQFDIGGVYKGYHADLSRVACVGDPSEKQLDVFDTVVRAQDSALALIKAGTDGSMIDRQTKEMVQTKGYEPYPHGLGHGVGLARGAHEAPTISDRKSQVLTEDMCVTIEPAVYIPDEFGVRIEDVIRVTADGYERLTASNRDIIIVG